MEKFKGFPSGDMSQTTFPDILFEEIGPLIDDLDELKITLYYFWAISRQEGQIRYLRIEELLGSETLLQWLGEENLKEALRKTLARGTLLMGQTRHPQQIRCLFPNSPQGQTAIAALRNNAWHPDETDHLPFQEQGKPEKNLYTLYEKNIGPLTPMIAEDLSAALEEYSIEWIEDAIHAAVQSNVRNWRYVEAILRTWKKEGKYADTRRNSKKDGRRISTGEFDEFIQH